MGESQLTSKGQVTIPKTIRKAFHLEEGDRVAFAIDGIRIVVYPLTQDIFSLRGMLKKPHTKEPLDYKKLRAQTLAKWGEDRAKQWGLKR